MSMFALCRLRELFGPDGPRAIRQPGRVVSPGGHGGVVPRITIVLYLVVIGKRRGVLPSADRLSRHLQASSRNRSCGDEVGGCASRRIIVRWLPRHQYGSEYT